jgi:hypothetical protein
MLFDTLGKDFGFDKHIFNALMLFLKVGVIGDESIYGFGRGGDIACGRYKAILYAEVIILFLRAYGLTSHIPNAVDRDTIGEEPTILGLGHISLSSVHTRYIKVGVISHNCFDLIELA